MGPVPTPSRTPRPTITPTYTPAAGTGNACCAPTAPLTGTLTPAALTISNVLLVRVDRDPTRDNGAIVSLQAVYSGGYAPYTIYHDDTLQPTNPFKVLATCGGSLAHTLRITSGDGQSVTKQYQISPVNCPP